MTTRIPVVLVVTFLSACGPRAQPPAAPRAAPSAATASANLPESTPDDDYVVGPFVTSSEDGESAPTYYIVRN